MKSVTAFYILVFDIIGTAQWQRRGRSALVDLTLK
jgi:hypothetical protein